MNGLFNQFLGQAAPALRESLIHEQKQRAQKEGWRLENLRQGKEELKSLLESSAYPVGLFAPNSHWFEAENLEEFLSQICPGKTWAYPRIHSETQSMEFAQCNLSQTQTHPKWRVREAPRQAAPCLPKLVFAPATAASKKGDRLGRGAGHYDRYLAQHPTCKAIGVVHEDYVLDRFEASWVQAHDQKLSGLLTQKQFINLRRDNL